jgi:hypothetical protein
MKVLGLTPLFGDLHGFMPPQLKKTFTIVENRKKTLTTTVLEAEIGEPPNVTEANGIGNTGHDKIPLGTPGTPLLIRSTFHSNYSFPV